MPRLLLAVLLSLGVAALAQPPAELFEYLAATRGGATWEVLSSPAMGAGRAPEIRLRSQTWRGIPWDHTLVVYEPATVVVEDVVVLFISGDAGPWDALLGMTAAALSGLRVAILCGVPNQPLFGLIEDALIAHTFERYLADGDPDWPLLLPMVRSAHAAMEALEALAPELWGTEIRGFVVAGASKRGWTAYLTAATAADRVLGLVPLVFDFLNIPAQLQHQEESLGAPSPMLRDYVGRDLTAALGEGEAAVRLGWIVDPYSYRYALTMPKLVVVGSNDLYWTVDATSLYWPGLPEPKLLFVVPNAGHGLLDLPRVMGSLAAFARLVARGEAIPWVASAVRFTASGATLRLTADRQPAEARLWTTRSLTRDFQRARWEKQELAAGNTAWEAALVPPDTGYLGFFAELVFVVDGLRLHVSTPTRVLGP
jgi:PhoPQ-activated pathogenicity-related protein